MDYGHSVCGSYVARTLTPPHTHYYPPLCCCRWRRAEQLVHGCRGVCRQRQQFQQLQPQQCGQFTAQHAFKAVWIRAPAATCHTTAAPPPAIPSSASGIANVHISGVSSVSTVLYHCCALLYPFSTFSEFGLIPSYFSSRETVPWCSSMGLFYGGHSSAVC